MNRPPQSGKRFLHQFSDGTQVVAKFKKSSSVAHLNWSKPPSAGILFEYIRWRDTTLQKISNGKCRTWADVWPS